MLALEIMPDHQHLFVSAKPTHVPCDIMKKLKGNSSIYGDNSETCNIWAIGGIGSALSICGQGAIIVVVLDTFLKMQSFFQGENVTSCLMVRRIFTTFSANHILTNYVTDLG